MVELVRPDEPIRVQSEVRYRELFMRKTERYRKDHAIPRALAGRCLNPFLMEGDCVWVDSGVEPRDRDLVVAVMTFVTRPRHVFSETSESGRSRRVVQPERTVRAESLKLLRIIDGKRYLVTANDGSERMGAVGAVIVGTVTAWYRQRWWRRPAMRKLRGLSP